MKTLPIHPLTLTAILPLCLAFFTGCASTKQMQQVQTRVDSQYQTQQQIRQQLADQTKAMQNLVAQHHAFEKRQVQQMQTFTHAYSPEVRAELAENLQTSAEHRKEVARLLATSKHDREHIAKMLSASSRELAIIKQNRKESEVVNVVNQFEKVLAEFNALNRSWDKTVQTMQEQSDQHLTAVKSSAQSAALALVESRKASLSAKKAQDFAAEVNLYNHRIRDLDHRLKKALRDIHHLDNALDAQQRENRNLQSQIRDLERKMRSKSHS